MPTIEQLLAVAEVTLLEIGGVDNWDWYSEAMEDYTPSGDEYEDAEDYLNALETNGVDNWDWYGESLTGLSEYEDYLRNLPSLDKVLDIYSWQLMQDSEEEEIVPEVKESTPSKAQEKVRPEGIASGMIYDHIASKVGTERANAVYVASVENGLWKQSTFPKEFKIALKEIQAGVKEPLEAAKQKLASLIIKNGKLNTFIKDF